MYSDPIETAFAAVLTVIKYALPFVGFLVALAATVKILPEYERIVVFRFGRILPVKGPGIAILIPGVDRGRRIDMRTKTADLEQQDIITKDNVTVKVKSVVYYKIVDAVKVATMVEDDFQEIVRRTASTMQLSILGSTSLDVLLGDRDSVRNRLKIAIDEQTEPWGIQVSGVEILGIDLPEGMIRAMAKEAEAEREKRAKAIHAEGEKVAAETLAEAAKMLQQEPGAMELRKLQTLAEIATEQNSTIIFPMDLFSKAKELLDGLR